MTSTTRKPPSAKTLRRLFVLSGNQCAKPGCGNVIVSAAGTFVGAVCHITADRPRGPRYDADIGADARRGFDNLILLCANHHAVVDAEPKTYTVPVLRRWKHDRESKFAAIGELLHKGYELQIEDETAAIDPTAPETLAGLSAFLQDRKMAREFDDDAPGEVAAYVGDLKKLSSMDRQLMRAIVEKALELGGRREARWGIAVHPDDLKTILVNRRPLSDHRIKRLGDTMRRHGVGDIDVDDGIPELSIRAPHDEITWAELQLFAQSRGATLARFIEDLEFRSLDVVGAGRQPRKRKKRP